MTAALPPAQRVYTPQEVASALRVSSETIRRKIVSGELHALEVGGTARKQYRIFASDLVSWLGQERATLLFGLDAVEHLRQAWKGVSDETLDAALEEATRHARAVRPTPHGPAGPTPSAEQRAAHARKSRVKSGAGG